MENVIPGLLSPLGAGGFPLLLLLMVFTLGAAFITSGFGIGGGVLLTPLFILFLPPKVGIALIAPMFVIMSATAVRQYWGQWNPFHILVLLPAALVGIWIGTHLLSVLPATYIVKTVGVLAVLFGSLQFLGIDRPEWMERLRPRTWMGVGLGLGSGVGSGMAHTGGIVFSFYLLPNSPNREMFVATTVCIFFVTGLLKVGTYVTYGILTWPIFRISLLLIPAMALGSLFGKLMNRRISNRLFLRVISTMIVLMGVKLLWQ